MEIKVLLFIILLYIIKNNPYSINLVDENMGDANYIRPITSDDGYLYIMTGETADPDNFQPGDLKFKRSIIKYSPSGKYEKNDYSNRYPFNNFEITLVNNNILFITTLYSIEFLNSNYKYTETPYSIYGYRRTMKKAGTYFIYAHSDKDIKDSLYIDKIKLNYKIGSDLPTPTIIKTSNKVPVLTYHAMYSCDLTGNNNYILCAYFSPEKNVRLSIFSADLNLIKTEEYENVPDSYPDYFIKILYFKDNSKFILINSITDSKIRLRYFNYINNKIISHLYSIISNGNTYLDVDETQLGPEQYNNEIIAADNYKIIKIHVNYDIIIITIFNFLEHDTILYIKKYKMKNYNENGFNSFTQPRLAMFKNTLIVCISTNYNNQPKQSTGFFFLNYPNSKDINLSGNTNIVKIKELISIENNLYSLNLKLKILKIPQDFILRNSNSAQIKENDILDINDEIKLVQYRKNKQSNIFKYVGVSIGKEMGFLSSEIYSSYKTAIEEQNIYIEGREGEIQFNYNGQNCLNEYYHLDYDLDLCTIIKPPKYYIDEENKIYKACQSPCEECNGPIINNELMNCITCKSNFYITEDTNSCYKEKENYYLDNNILRRCHPRCSKCITGSKNDTNMNCLECLNNTKDNYFSKKDSFNCILSSEFYKINYISGNFKKIKISEIITNNKFSLTLKFKILKIPQDFIFMNSKSEEIKENDILEINDEIRVMKYRKNGQQNIFKFVGLALSSEIYPSNKNYKEKSIIFFEGREGEIQFNYNGQNCLNEYYHLDYDLDLCTIIKPPKYYIDEENKIYKACQSPCEECNGPIINNELMNCITCKSNFYITEDTNSCYKEKENYYLDNNILRRCHPRCSKCITGSKNDTNMNCLECIYNSEENYFYKEDTLNCILPSEFHKRDFIHLSTVPNYVFYIFVAILIFSIIISFSTILSLISKKEKLPQIIGYKIIKKKHIELPEYNQPIPEDKDEEKEDKEEENNIN